MLLAAWITTTSALFGGCTGLFRPAKPEAPSATTGGGEITPDYGLPSAALETMAQGIAAKARGQTAYIGAFSDSARDGYPFYADFDPDVARRFEASGGPVPVWNLTREKLFYPDLIGVRTQNYIMRWTANEAAGDDDFDPATGDSTLHRRYEVFSVSNDGNTLSTIAVGLADLRFKHVTASRWAIVRWQDYVDPAIGINPADPDQITLGERRLKSQG